MRALRLVGWVAATLLLALLAVAWLAPRFVDWDRYRPAIVAAASSRLGRPVQIAGPLNLALLPSPVLVAAAVTVPDIGDGFAAEVTALRMQLALGPLLAGRLEVEDLFLRGVQLHLPWPPPPDALMLRPPPALAGMRVAVADATVLVAGLAVDTVDARITVDRLGGGVTLTGQGTALGRRWRGAAQLGRPGGDGSASLDASLDAGSEEGGDAAEGLGVRLSGQVAADGSVTGQASGQGRDLSQVTAGPAAPWRASGRFRAADGLVLAEDLDLDIAGAPARGAVALRLLPTARLDMALSTSRLDLDAWLPGLVAANGRALPTSIDLSAEAATLAGGTLRHLHAAVDFLPDEVSVNTAEAVLPGDAALSLSGHLAGGRFSGTGRLATPALRDTLRWLQPAPALAAALPPDVLQTATVEATFLVGGGLVALDPLTGTVDGAGVAGSLTVLGGERPTLSARLALDGPVLDPWMPDPFASLPGLASALAAWPGRWDRLDGALTLTAAHPRLRGAALDAGELDVSLHEGALTLRRAAASGPGFAVALRGTLAPRGHVADGVLDGSVTDAAALVTALPPGWLAGWSSGLLPSGLLHGRGTLHGTAAGTPDRLGISVQAGLGDLTAEATGTADLPRSAWDGAVALRHPGAPRLLAALGLPGVASWLGDGSFALAGDLTLDASEAALSGLSLSAGQLRATGGLHLDRGATPSLTGRLDAETLPLPGLALRSPEPMPLGALAGWRAQIGLSAAHVLFGLTPGLEDLSCGVVLEGGALNGGSLRVTQVSGKLAGGLLTGQAALDTAGTPHLAVSGTLAGVTLTDPQAVLTGRLNAEADLTASGFSAGALLGTLDGTAHLAVTEGALGGLDLPAVDTALAAPDPAVVQAGVARALAGGHTAFTSLDANAAVHGGVVVVHEATLAAPSGRMALSGTLDLPIDAADLRVTLTQTLPGAPAIGLRLIGPAAAPRRTPELAGLAGWLAER